MRIVIIVHAIKVGEYIPLPDQSFGLQNLHCENIVLKERMIKKTYNIGTSLYSGCRCSPEAPVCNGFMVTTGIDLFNKTCLFFTHSPVKMERIYLMKLYPLWLATKIVFTEGHTQHLVERLLF